MKPQHISNYDWLYYNSLFICEHFLGHHYYKKLFGTIDKRFLERMRTTMKIHPPVHTHKFIEYQESDHQMPYFNPDAVMVFRGAAKNWKCYEKWSFDYFSQHYGDTEIEFYGSPGLNEKKYLQKGTMTLRKYIEELRKGSKQYLKFSPVIQSDSSLRADFDAQYLEKFSTRGMFGRKFFFFMGAAKTVTPIHCALGHTAFIQIRGSKKWKFWEPNDRMHLGARSEGRAYFYTDAAIDGMPTEDFPLLNHAKSYDLILNEGDVVWFPGFFWHHVENLSDSIGVAYKFAHLPTAARSSKVLTALAFLSTKPFLIVSLYKSLFSNFGSSMENLK